MEVKVAHLRDHDLRVQADGLSMDVSLAVYSMVNLVFWHFPSITCNGAIGLLSLLSLCVRVRVPFRILVQLMDVSVSLSCLCLKLNPGHAMNFF